MFALLEGRLLLAAPGISWSPGIRWSRWPVPGWPDVVPALPALLVLRSPQEPKKILLMRAGPYWPLWKYPGLMKLWKVCVNTAMELKCIFYVCRFLSLVTTLSTRTGIAGFAAQTATPLYQVPDKGVGRMVASYGETVMSAVRSSLTFDVQIADQGFFRCKSFVLVHKPNVFGRL